MDNDRDQVIGTVIIGTIIGGFISYWAIRGLWWIVPKILFLGVPIFILSFIIAGILYLGILKYKSKGLDFQGPQQIFYGQVSFRRVLFIQIFLIGLSAWYIQQNIPKAMFDDKGKERGIVVLYPRLHHGYNDFAKSWQASSIFEAQSKSPYQSEFFDGSYVNLILWLSVGVFGPGLFLFLTRNLEFSEKKRIDAVYDKKNQDYKKRYLDDVNSFSEKYKKEVERLNQDLVQIRNEYADLKRQHVREKAKTEFFEKEHGVEIGAGVLDGDVLL